MSERGTPRTDEAADRCSNCGLAFVLADDMREVERELGAMRADAEYLLDVWQDGANDYEHRTYSPGALTEAFTRLRAALAPAAEGNAGSTEKG